MIEIQKISRAGQAVKVQVLCQRSLRGEDPLQPYPRSVTNGSLDL